ncbi:MAG: DUF4443 domain-containing protein [Candidatus Bathyarchaeia archaeon]
MNQKQEINACQYLPSKRAPAANQMKTLQAKEMDVIVIVGADSIEKAEYGALAAAWTLLGKQ